MTGATTEPERLVVEYSRLWNEREFSKLSDVVADSFTLTSPTAGTVKGRDAVEAHVREVIDGFPDYHITVHETIVGDGVVVAESTHSGTHAGAFDGFPPSGESFEVGVMVKFVVEGGELREERAYFDRYTVLSQLGLVEV
jgi:steroid delta-isomerase-like uncharacterized protein